MAKSICYAPCKTTGLAFSISQNALQGPFRAGVGVTDCSEDFLLIANGYDQFNKGQRNDRFCGTIFNPNGNVTAYHADQIAAGSTTICCNVKSISIQVMIQFLDYFFYSGHQTVPISLHDQHERASGRCGQRRILLAIQSRNE